MNLFDKFYQTVNIDFDVYRPGTTNEEKQCIFEKVVHLLSTQVHHIEWISESEYIDSHKGCNKKNVFMYRKIYDKTIVQHEIPQHYKLFLETSSDLFTNYMKTIDNLQGNSFLIQDIENCKNSILDIDRVLCWSNTSILLNQVLKKYNNPDLQIITFGSPIILPKYNCKSCLNIYHEDDWILGFMTALYKIDMSRIQTNIIYHCLIDSKSCEFVILSSDKFSESILEPHRCFNKFF